MAYEKKPGDMVLFVKDKVENNRPVMSGTIFIDGENKEFALWAKKSAAGNTFYAGSLKLDGSVKPKQASTPFNKPAPTKADLDDDLPF